MTDQLRVGVLGAGFIANVHVNAYAATPDARVVGVADPVGVKAERLALEVGASVVPDLPALLELGVDAVSVCTPPATHAELTVTALAAGAHVLCEKPLARTLDDARRIVDAAEHADGMLMVGHVSRFEPDHALAKQLVDEGQIGPVRMMSHSITTSLPGWSEAGWLGDLHKSGGPLLDLAVHSFDYLAWVIGSEPVRLHALGADTPVGPATYTTSTVRYANDAIGLVECSWGHPVARGFKLATEIVGPKGRLTWSYDTINGGALYPSDGDPEWFDPLSDRGFRAEVDAFVAAIRTGGPSPVPVRAAYDANRTALAALESVQTGTTIDMTEWGAL